MYYKGSIKKRLIIIIMLIASLTGLISYGSFVYWYMQNQHEKAVTLAQTVGLVLGQDFAKLILLNEVSVAADITSQLKSFSTLNSMVLYKLDKKAIFQYNKEDESFIIKALPSKFLEETKVENNTLNLYIKARYKDTKLGYLQFSFQIDTITDVIKKDIKALFLILSFIFVISYFFAIYYAKKFTKPILNLVSFLEQIEHTDSLSKRINTSEKNEFGKLYEEANTMLERISTSQQALKLAAVAFETQSGMIITDKNKKILQVNRAFTSITGYEADEVISKTPSILKSGLHTKEFYNNMFYCLNNYKFWMGEIKNLHKNGTLVNESLTIQAVHNESDEVIYYVASFIDITEQKKAEERLKEKDRMLVHQSKMAAMGEMIGNIAHQWRQPLSIISVITSGMIIKKDFDITDDEDDKKELKKIGETVTYLSETIDDFKNFFKPDKERKVFNIKDCYKKTINLVGSRLNSLDIEVIEDIQDIELNCLENELKQVIMNLLNNSKDALEQKEDNRKLIFINIYKENNNAIFFIKDTGGGIPKHIINNIFKPYFSTKDTNQGTGIGLYMSIEMVEKHMNGKLLVGNETFIYDGIEYTGACFKIAIPFD